MRTQWVMAGKLKCAFAGSIFKRLLHLSHIATLSRCLVPALEVIFGGSTAVQKAKATRVLAHNRFDVDGLEILYHLIKDQSPGPIEPRCDANRLCNRAR